MSEGAQKKQEKARKFQAIRGTRDLLPPDTALWNHVEQTAHEVFATFGYAEIRPPILEDFDLFARSIGGDTDVVAKEMYSFDLFASREVIHLQGDLYFSLDNPLRFTGNLFNLLACLKSAWDAQRVEHTERNRVSIRKMEDIYDELYASIADDEALERAENNPRIQKLIQESAHASREIEVWPHFVVMRPEATASVCRAYIEHNMQQWPQPVKLYYIGPMFRRERPQKGRFRQFYQIGAEVLEAVRKEVASGEWRVASKELAKDAAVDAEVIEMLMTFFERIGLQGTELSVNSIGHAADNCRRGYVAKLREELTKVKEQLGADSQRRIETNPLRVLDSKLEHEQAIVAKLPHIADHLCDECKTHYAEMKRQLDLRGVKYKENWRLVRGLDYYMRTTFEITARGLGSQDAVCGGGRYDGLVELLGGPPTKGIGFAIGEDRVILSLQDQKSQAAVASHSPLSVYIAWLGEKAYATALRAAKTLRANGFRVEMPATELRFGKALERASKLSARFALILGDDEVASGQWTLKTLADGSQQKLTQAALLEYLSKL